MYWYIASVFILSILAMVLEITAGRLVAPYLGLSMYSWSLVVSVILCGLAIGHWVGGVWADNKKYESAPGWVLLVCGFASLAIVLLVIPVGHLLDATELNLLSASVLFVTPLFLLPAICLGVVVPIFITRALKLDTRIGRIVGLMLATMVFGSVCALFISTFLLIPYLGTRKTIVFIGIVCIVLAVAQLWPRKKTAITTGLGLLVVLSAIALTSKHSLLCDAESISVCLRVEDSSEFVPYGNARGLMRDHLVQNINYEDNARVLVSPDAHLVYELLLPRLKLKPTDGVKIFFGGSGAYSIPRAILLDYPKTNMVIAEPETQLAEVISKMFWQQPESSNVSVQYSDPRRVLLGTPKSSLDFVVGDVFHDIVIPFHLLSLEYFRLTKSRLKADGKFLVNVIDIYPDPQLVKAAVKTLRLVFSNVDVWIDNIPTETSRQTYVISASDQSMQSIVLQSQTGWAKREWSRDTSFILDQGKPLSLSPVLTDDFGPVEYLLSPLIFSKLGR